MPVREFVDSNGVEWRAWEVTPDALYPPTRGEDYLADCYQLGWIVLETKSGDRRVRVCPIPRNWQQFDDAQLEALLEAGEALPATAPPGRTALADAPRVRSFRFPGGGVWTVSVAPHPLTHGSRVLRFSAGGRVVDVDKWPADWTELSDSELVGLLSEAMSRDGGARTDAEAPPSG
jgi:hypothetical protein